MDSIPGKYHVPVRHTLRAAVVLSVMFHAGAAGLLSWTGTHSYGSMARAGQVSQLDVFQVFKNPEPELPKPEPPKPEEVVVQPPPPPEPELDPDRVRLGIDDSNADSRTWKGAAQATEHLAPKSEVDQPALAISPGAPGQANPGISDSGAANQAAMMGPPIPTAESQPTTSEAAPAAPEPAEAESKPMQLELPQDQPLQPEVQQPLPEQLLPQQLLAKQPFQVDPGTGLIELGPLQDSELQLLLEQPKALQDKDQQLKPVQPKDMQKRPVFDEPKEPLHAPDPKDAAKEKASPPQGNSGTARQGAPGVKANSPDAQPGQKAEEESAAAAVVESLVYRPGQPLAGKGLQVRTVNPRWGVTTMLTAAPKDTVIRVTFGRSGKVIKAVFADSGTGFADVDGPLLDAVYRWTAKGEVLQKIPADKPQAGLNFDIKFLMHGAR